MPAHWIVALGPIFAEIAHVGSHAFEVLSVAAITVCSLANIGNRLCGEDTEENKPGTHASHFRRLSQFLHRHSIQFPIMTKKEELRRHPRFSRGVRCLYSGWHMGKQRIRFDGEFLEVPDATSKHDMGKLWVSKMYARFDSTKIELIQKEPAMQQFTISFAEEQEAKLWKDFLTQAAKDFAPDDHTRLQQLRLAIKKQQTVLNALNGLELEMRRQVEAPPNGDSDSKALANGIDTKESSKKLDTSKSSSSVSKEGKDPGASSSLSRLSGRRAQPAPTNADDGKGSIKSLPPSLPSDKSKESSLTRSRSSERLDKKAATDEVQRSEKNAPAPDKSKLTLSTGGSLAQKLAASEKLASVGVGGERTSTLSSQARFPLGTDKNQARPADSTISPFQRMLEKRSDDKVLTPSSQTTTSVWSEKIKTEARNSRADGEKSKSTLTGGVSSFLQQRTLGTGAAAGDTNSTSASSKLLATQTNSGTVQSSSPFQRLMDRRNNEAKEGIDGKEKSAASSVNDKVLTLGAQRTFSSLATVKGGLQQDKTNDVPPRAFTSLTQRMNQRIDSLKEVPAK